nr:MAG TPA: hypothetical protein [Caudoviricetes sp.]
MNLAFRNLPFSVGNPDQNLATVTVRHLSLSGVWLPAQTVKNSPQCFIGSGGRSAALFLVGKLTRRATHNDDSLIQE